MKYNISSTQAPKMQNLGKGTEIIKFKLTQVSKDMYETLVPMPFPIPGAHVSGAESQHPSNVWMELCGKTANLGADSGCNKGLLNGWVEAIRRDFRAHDDVPWDIPKRAIVSAWKAGCIMWILNNQSWAKSIRELEEWLVYHDIWSKM